MQQTAAATPSVTRPDDARVRQGLPLAWVPGVERPRLLIEAQDVAERRELAQRFDASGFDVVTCGGPRSLAGGRCSLVLADICPPMEQADVVLHLLDQHDADSRAVLAALQRAFPATPIAVLVDGAESVPAAPIPAGCHVLPATASTAEVSEALHRIARRRHAG